MSMRQRADDVMTRPPLCAAETVPLREALRIMRNADIRHLVVVDEQGRVAGIVSERDLKRRMGTYFETSLERPRDRLLMRAPLREVMTEAITAPASAALTEVVRTMRDDKLGAMPIVDDDGRPLGIITGTDLLRVLVSLLEGKA
jgi:acetoin utilization protein AcuB